MTGFFKDLFSGNFKAVEADISSAVAKLPSWAQSLISTLESDEGQILNGLVAAGAQELLKGGLTTANFTATAKSIEAQLVSQNINLGTQTIYAALNGAVAGLVPTAVPVATPPANGG